MLFRSGPLRLQAPQLRAKAGGRLQRGTGQWGSPQGAGQRRPRGSSPPTSPGASWTPCPGWGLRGPPGGCSARGQRGQWSVETGRARRARNPSGVGEALPWGWGPAQIPGLCRSTPHPQPASSLGGGGSPHHPDPPSTASPSSAPLPGPGSVRLGDRKSTRQNSSHRIASRMPSSA